MTTPKREPSFGEALARIREEHTEWLTGAIASLVRFPYASDRANDTEANRIAKAAIQQATAAVAAAYVKVHEHLDAEKAQAKQDAALRLFKRPGRWGGE